MRRIGLNVETPEKIKQEQEKELTKAELLAQAEELGVELTAEEKRSKAKIIKAISGRG